MPYGPQLERLAARWREQPRSTVFAPLADALRKAGATAAALDIARSGVAARPEYLPGHLVLARIHLDGDDWRAAEAVLRAAAALDAEHPVVQRELTAVAARQVANLPSAIARTLAPQPVPTMEISVRGVAAAPLVEDAGIDEEMLEQKEVELEADHDELVLTESLAMLYREQGHLDRALDVFQALVARQPDNRNLVARRDGIRAELDAQRPRPYAASRSGGLPVRAWLASMATAVAPPAPPSSSFDAFYQAPDRDGAEAGDLAAFQAWLRGLER